MKLLTYESGSETRAGLLVDGVILDVTALLGLSAPLRDVGALLELDDGLRRLKEVASSDELSVGIALTEARLRPPVLRPPTFRDFALFEEHITQQFTRGNDEDDDDLKKVRQTHE